MVCSLLLSRCRVVTAFALVFLASSSGYAVLGTTLRGIVHDPAHRPVPGAHITLAANDSALTRETTTDAEGSFQLAAVPLGLYRVRVEAAGFAPELRALTLASGDAPVLHVQLALAAVLTSMTVTASTGELEANATTRTDLISRSAIEATPGADLTNSLRLITEFVPGAAVVHDQLHVRGGHQVTWAINGVPLPNTNIATNVGPQFSPRDISDLEVQTGGVAADYGDRTYGVFNVATRTGFERDHEAELVTTFGTYNQTDSQLSLGDHSSRSAWYLSLSGNRTGYGLEPPTQANLHNLGSGGSVFTSVVSDLTPADQLRFTGAYRADFFQVPNDPDQQDAGARDREREQDGFGTLTWTHSFNPHLTGEASPFFHSNRAAFVGGPLDQPSATSNRLSLYEGGQALLSLLYGPSNLRAGVYSFAQQDTTLFSLTSNDNGGGFRQTVRPGGLVIAAFADEQWRARSWLTLTGGLRVTSFAGNLGESAWDPRLGAALQVPRFGWVIRATYARFYQAPPLDTVNGPLFAFAAGNDLGFLPLHGERDEQYDVGLTLPVRGWTLDLDRFRTAARNYFDHDSLGNSNIFLPLTIDRARTEGWEANLRSPLITHCVRGRIIFSNQSAEGFGGVTGGRTDFSPAEGGFYLDHDQRNTLSAALEAPRLPGHASGSLVFNYGSGFLDGDGPDHLPSYRTVDLSLTKGLSERLTVRVSLTNSLDKRYQLDRSNTFGGSHVGDPRMIYGEVRWRFPFR